MRVFLVALMVGIGGDVGAREVDWSVALERDSDTIYIDLNAVRESSRKVWMLQSFKHVQTVKNKKFLSRKVQFNVDCAKEETAPSFVTITSGKMGTGKVIYSGAVPLKWEHIEPDRSIGEVLLKVICFEQEIATK